MNKVGQLIEHKLSDTSVKPSSLLKATSAIGGVSALALYPVAQTVPIIGALSIGLALTPVAFIGACAVAPNLLRKAAEKMDKIELFLTTPIQLKKIFTPIFRSQAGYAQMPENTTATDDSMIQQGFFTPLTPAQRLELRRSEHNALNNGTPSAPRFSPGRYSS